MKKKITAIALIGVVLSLMLSYNKVKALSADILSDSATIYGAYNVQHDLELWYNFDSDCYHWWAKCYHYAWNINTFGSSCYCNCTIESDNGTILAQSGRAYAVYVNSKWKSVTSHVDDTSYFHRGHAYCGTEPH